jgi:hypothetical protein
MTESSDFDSALTVALQEYYCCIHFMVNPGWKLDKLPSIGALFARFEKHQQLDSCSAALSEYQQLDSCKTGSSCYGSQVSEAFHNSRGFPRRVEVFYTRGSSFPGPCRRDRCQTQAATQQERQIHAINEFVTTSSGIITVSVPCNQTWHQTKPFSTVELLLRTRWGRSAGYAGVP